MPEYNPLKPNKEKVGDYKTFTCQCGNKLSFCCGGKYEAVKIECVKCQKQIKLIKAEVEQLG